jgi:aspartate/methionine/tyrosine aminotransferase
MGICREHCETSNKEALMKNKKNYVMTSAATLTQNGLLAVLLQRQHYKVIDLARRRAQREQARAAFRSTLNWLLGLARGGIAGRPFRRGFEESVRRPT